MEPELFNLDQDLFEDLMTLSNPILEREQGSLEVNPYQDYDTARELAEKHLPEYERLLKKALSGRKGKVLTDIKSSESFDSKLRRGKTPEEVKDVLRGTIVVARERDLHKVARDLQKLAIVNKAQYFDEPDDEYGYHGAWHIDIEIGKGDERIIAEVQIKTGRLKSYAEPAHDIYSDTREEKKAGKLTPDDPRLKESRKIFLAANRPQAIEKQRYRAPRRGRTGDPDLSGV